MNSSPETPPPAFQTATPRTDAEAVDLSYNGKAAIEDCHVPVPFARELERQLLENLRIQSSREDRFREEQLIIARKAQELEARLASLTEEKDALQRYYDMNIVSWKELTAKHDAVCAENQRLAESLESARMHHQESLDRLRSQRDELEVQLAQLTQHDKGGAPNAS